MLIKVRAGKHMIITRVAQISTSREVILVFFWVNISCRDYAPGRCHIFIFIIFHHSIRESASVSPSWAQSGPQMVRPMTAKLTHVQGGNRYFPLTPTRSLSLRGFWDFGGKVNTDWNSCLQVFFLGRGKCGPISINYAYLRLVGCGCLFCGRNPDHSMVIWVICTNISWSKINIQSSERFQIIWNVFVWCESANMTKQIEFLFADLVHTFELT